MSSRIVTGFMKWLVGVAVFVAVTMRISDLFVLGMTEWASEHGCSLGFVYEMRFLRIPILALCVMSGAIYAAALARSESFGGAGRVWRHLAGTYFCNLLGSAIFVRAGFLPLPDFPRHFEMNAYLFVVYGLATACFAAGLISWVQVAFRSVSVRKLDDASLADQSS